MKRSKLLFKLRSKFKKNVEYEKPILRVVKSDYSPPCFNEVYENIHKGLKSL